jgi:hypothetical protein
MAIEKLALNIRAGSDIYLQIEQVAFAAAVAPVAAHAHVSMSLQIIP